MTTPVDAKTPLNVFVSYQRRDAELKKLFDVHLKILEDRKLIKVWSDNELVGGEKYDSSIAENMRKAQIIVFLVSPNFLASDFIQKSEVPLALQMLKAGEAIIVPVILTPTPSWENEEWAPKIQAMPSTGRPVDDDSWKTKERAFAEVERQLRLMLPKVPEMLRQNRRIWAPAGQASLVESPQEIDRNGKQTPAIERKHAGNVSWLYWLVGLVGAGGIALAVFLNRETPVASKETPGVPQISQMKPALLNAVAVKVLSGDGTVLTNPIPARRVQKSGWGDGKVVHEVENGIQFDLRVQSIEGEIPAAMRIYYFIRTSEKPTSGRMTIDSTMEPGLNPVVDEAWKAKGYTRTAWWNIAENKSDPMPLPGMTLLAGKDGSIPPGEHEIGIEIRNNEAVLYRGELKLSVLELDPKDVKVKVLSGDGGSIASPIPARRIQKAGWSDGKVSHEVENGIQFDLRVKNMEGGTPPPLHIDYFIQTNEKPLPGKLTIDSTMEPGLNPVVDEAWKARGYTRTAWWIPSVNEPDPTLLPGLTLLAGKDGSIPPGEHRIGIEIKANGVIMYCGEVTLSVPALSPH